MCGFVIRQACPSSSVSGYSVSIATMCACAFLVCREDGQLSEDRLFRICEVTLMEGEGEARTARQQPLQKKANMVTRHCFATKQIKCL